MNRQERRGVYPAPLQHASDGSYSFSFKREINRERGRVRDISSQYHRRTLATKILASLNRRCTVIE